MSPARGDDTNPKLTSKQVRSLIANAKTPEDHQKLAAYYRDMAEQAKANAAEHEKILAAYNQNPSTHPPAKAAGGPAEHCRIPAGQEENDQNDTLLSFLLIHTTCP
jgi:hypothetical protein